MNMKYFLAISYLKGDWGCGRWQSRHGYHKRLKPLWTPLFKLQFSSNSSDLSLGLLVLMLVITSI